MSYQKFTKDIGIMSLAYLTLSLQGLIVLPFITKLLGVENYGIWAQLIITLSLITPIAVLGLPYTLVRFLAGEKDRKEIQDGIYSVLLIIFVVASAIALGVFLSGNSISTFFGCEARLVKILAFVIIFEALNLVFLNIFRAFQQIKKYTFFVIFRVFGEIGLIITAILLEYGLFGAVLSLLIIRLITCFIMGSYIIKRIGFKIPKFLKIKEYLHFSLPLIPGNFSSWAVESSDRYLIGFFLGTFFVGCYAPAYIIGNSITFLIAPLIFILPTVVSKFYDENKIDKVKIYLKYSLKYFLILGIPSVFGLSILSKQLLTIFSTSEIALHGYNVVPFIAISLLLFGVSAILGNIIFLKKKTMVSGIVWLIGAFLNLGLNFIFIPKFGIIGAGITTFIAYTAMFVIGFGYCYFKYRELLPKIGLSFILKSIFVSILMSLFIVWFAPTGLFKTIIVIILGALIYGVLIFLFKGFARDEIIFFKKFLRK